MNKAKISLIAGITKDDRGLGKENKLLWHISADLKRFKELTTGHPIIMGRKTFESIGRPLPNRTNIIITRNPDFKSEWCVVVHSLDEAIKKAQDILDAESNPNPEMFIIGGGEIYKEAINIANKLYLTVVLNKKEADTFFPDYSQFTKEVFREEHLDTQPQYMFLELEK